MKEPPRINDINELAPYLVPRVLTILSQMREHGYDPIVIETRRSIARQRYLYGQGRTKWQCARAGISPLYARKGNVVTWTLKSNHATGKAVDIISKRNGYNESAFFKALKKEAELQGMHTLPLEACHIEWRG